MGCTKVGHCHQWPTAGSLIIQRCEIRCNFCEGDAAKKDWKYAWFLRRHVRAIHVKKGQYPNLEVECGWNDAKPRSSKKKEEKRKARKSKPEKVEWVMQPTYEEQQIDQQLPGAFDEMASVHDRTVNPADIVNLSSDAIDFSIDDIKLATEQAASVPGGSASFNIMDDFIGSMIPRGPLDSDDYADNDNIDPSLLDPANNPIDLTLSDDVEINTPTTVPPARKHAKSTHADLPAMNFFIDDYKSAGLDDFLDDMPLVQAQAIDEHDNDQPDGSQLWQFLNSVDTGAQNLFQQGIQVEAMCAPMAIFARSYLASGVNYT